METTSDDDEFHLAQLVFFTVCEGHSCIVPSIPSLSLRERERDIRTTLEPGDSSSAELAYVYDCALLEYAQTVHSGADQVMDIRAVERAKGKATQ